MNNQSIPQGTPMQPMPQGTPMPQRAPMPQGMPLQPIPQTPQKPPKKKKGKAAKVNLIILAVVLAIAAVITVLCIVKKTRDDKIAHRFDVTASQAANAKIQEAYNNGDLDTDTYVRYMAYSVFDQSMLAEEYRSDNQFDSAVNIERIVEENAAELSDETLQYVFDNLYLTNIVIDTDASQNQTTVTSANPFSLDANAANPYNLTVLDKACLSEDGTFLVWYTETGDSAITKKQAEKLAANVESISEQVSDYVGVDYELHQQVHNGDYITPGYVLQECGIDESVLQTAMSVYVFKFPGNGTVLARYAKPPTFWADELIRFFEPIMDRDDKMEIPYVFAFPYIAIDSAQVSNEEGLNQIFAHEITHHYEMLYVDDLSYSEPLFPNETLANLASAYVVRTKGKYNLLNVHADEYVENCNIYPAGTGFVKDAELYGYIDFVWGKSYIDTVDGGLEYMKEAILQDSPGQYLREKAGDKCTDVLLDLSMRNLTKDYDSNAFIAGSIPQGQYWMNQHMDSHSDSLGVNTLHYYYFDRDLFAKNEYKLYFTANRPEHTFVELATRKGLDYAPLEVIYPKADEELLLIDFTEEKYQKYDEIIVIIGAAGSKVLDGTGYSICGYSENVLEAYTAFTGLSSLKPFEVNGECISFHIPELVAAGQEITNGSGGLKDIITASLDPSVEEDAMLITYSEQIVSELGRINSSLTEFGENFPYEYIRVYTMEVDDSVYSNEQLHQNAVNMLSGKGLRLIDEDIENYHISVGVSVHPFSDMNLEFYMLMTGGEEGPTFYRVECCK